MHTQATPIHDLQADLSVQNVPVGTALSLLVLEHLEGLLRALSTRTPTARICLHG
jgi:hypothetical protein